MQEFGNNFSINPKLLPPHFDPLTYQKNLGVVVNLYFNPHYYTIIPLLEA